MLRSLLKWAGPITRLLLYGFLAAGSWTIWMLIPSRPLHEFSVLGIDATTLRVSNDGKAGYLSDSDGHSALIRLPEGDNIVARDAAGGFSHFLENQRAVFDHYTPGCRLINLETGQAVWQNNAGKWFEESEKHWSRDGRRCVQECSGRKPRILVFDSTSNKDGIELSNAKSPFEIDDNGQFVLTRLNDDDAAIVLWDANTGAEIRRLKWPSANDVRSTSLSSDGTKLAAVYATDYSTTGATRFAILWNLVSGIGEPLVSPPTESDSRPTGATFFGNQTLIGPIFREKQEGTMSMWERRGLAMWNTAATRVTVATIKTPVYIDPTGRRYCRQEPIDPTTSIDKYAWVLYDSATHHVVVRERVGSEHSLAPHLSFDGRWGLFLFVAQDDDCSTIETWIEKWTGWKLRPRAWWDVIRLSDGHVVNQLRIPDEAEVCFTDRDTIWNINRHIEADDNEARFTILQEWPVNRRHIWAPWLVTSLAIVLAIMEIRTWIRGKRYRTGILTSHRPLSSPAR
jgi:hypothetical protein